MIEAGLAWILLLVGIISHESGWYIAAAGFAIAAQVSRIADAMKGSK